MASRAASIPQSPPFPAGLTRDQLLEIYRYLRLTRTLEERLTALYRQSKVIGGLFGSLGQEGESVGLSRCGASREWGWSMSATAQPRPGRSTRDSTSPRCSGSRSW